MGLDLEAWMQVVKRDAGSTGLVLRDRRLDSVSKALERCGRRLDGSNEATAHAVAVLITEIRTIRPLWSPFASVHRHTAAITAVEQLRVCGWTPDVGAATVLAAALKRREPQSQIMLRILAMGAPLEAVASNAEVYLSVPFSNRTSAMERSLKTWATYIEDELEIVGREIGVNLFLRAPALGMPEDPLTSMRAGLQRSVLHFILGSGGGSFGVGMEARASGTRRRPVIWFAPPGDDAPRSVRLIESEAALEIEPFATEADLRAAVSRAVRQNQRAIRALMREKDTMPVDLLRLQTELCRRWVDLGDHEALAVLRTVRISPDRLNLLLTNPSVLLHEASFSEVDALAAALGVDIFSVRRQPLRLTD